MIITVISVISANKNKLCAVIILNCSITLQKAKKK